MTKEVVTIGLLLLYTLYCVLFTCPWQNRDAFHALATHPPTCFIP